MRICWIEDDYRDMALFERRLRERGHIVDVYGSVDDLPDFRQVLSPLASRSIPDGIILDSWMPIGDRYASLNLNSRDTGIAVWKEIAAALELNARAVQGVSPIPIPVAMLTQLNDDFVAKLDASGLGQVLDRIMRIISKDNGKYPFRVWRKLQVGENWISKATQYSIGSAPLSQNPEALFAASN